MASRRSAGSDGLVPLKTSQLFHLFLLKFPASDGALFLFLPSAQEFFPPSVVHIGRRHVADAS